MVVAANLDKETLLKKEAAFKNVAEKICSILTKSKDPQRFMREDFKVLATIFSQKTGMDLDQGGLNRLEDIVMRAFAGQAARDSLSTIPRKI